MTFIGEGVVVSGDCMFLGRCGRTDLFGGDVDSQRKSLIHLRKRLLDLTKRLVGSSRASVPAI